MVGIGNLRLAFRRKGGWGRSKTAPLASKREMEGWWWGLGTSVSRFDAREGGGDEVGGGCGQQRCLFNVDVKPIIRHRLKPVMTG